MAKRNTKRQVIRNTDALRDISDRDNPVFKRISKSALVPGSSGTPTRRARCSENAPPGSTIQADLYSATTGVLATEGDEFDITVYCNLSGGVDLDEASRLLELGDTISVYESVFDNAGTPETRWYATEGFDVTEECACS